MLVYGAAEAQWPLERDAQEGFSLNQLSTMHRASVHSTVIQALPNVTARCQDHRNCKMALEVTVAGKHRRVGRAMGPQEKQTIQVEARKEAVAYSKRLEKA